MPTALHVPGLTDTQKLVLLSLTEHANAEHGDSTFVGQGRIAAEIGKGRTSVNRAIGALEDAGYITRQPNYRKTDDGRAYRSSDTNGHPLRRHAGRDRRRGCGKPARGIDRDVTP